MHFEMTDILFTVKTNVLGLNGITFTDKSLLFPHNTGINIDSLPFTPLLLGQ